MTGVPFNGMFAALSFCIAVSAAFAPQPSGTRRLVVKHAAVEDVKATERGRLLAEQMRGVNLFLVGAMGSGKTHVGEPLCRMLGSYTFVDTDRMIESAAATSITSIFDDVGEDAFRELESKVLQQVSAFVRLVVSTGGGIVLRKSNWAALRQGIVVFIDPSQDILVQRLQASEANGRPLLQGDPETIRDILDQRRPLYEQADVVVVVDDPDEVPATTAERVIDDVLTFIKQNPAKQPPPDARI